MTTETTEAKASQSPTLRPASARSLLSKLFSCATVADDAGVKYLERWYVVKTKPLSVYVHRIMKDDDADMHDHPWPFAVLILYGGYREVLKGCAKLRLPLDIYFHRPSVAHRIELMAGRESWSLVIMGPKVREWGFHTKAGWVHFKAYVKKAFVNCDKF